MYHNYDDTHHILVELFSKRILGRIFLTPVYVHSIARMKQGQKASVPLVFRPQF